MCIYSRYGVTFFTKIPCSFYLKTCSLSTNDDAHTDVNKDNDRQVMIVFGSFQLLQMSQKLKKSPVKYASRENSGS